MYTSISSRRRLLKGMIASLVIAMGIAADAPKPEKVPTLPKPAVVEAVAEKSVRTVTLAECIRVAMDKQPTLAAFRASRAAAETRLRAVNDLHVPTCLVRDLPIRRKQAVLGVVIAGEAVTREEREAAYIVTRLYYTVVYAHQQLATIDNALTSLRKFRVDAMALRKEGYPTINPFHLARMGVYIQLVESRREEAVIGIERATAALREALGLPPDCCLEPVDKELPFPRAELCRGDVVALALARRSELVMVTTGLQVMSLEIEAQAAQRGVKGQTFGAGRDPAAQAIPSTIRNSLYIPGGVNIEMPALMFGKKPYRVEQAQHLYERALAVADKTRNLITLEVEEAFLHWQEAGRRVNHLRGAAVDADKLARELASEVRTDIRTKMTPDDVLSAGVLAGQMRADATQALFQYVLALAALERATAGGVCPGWGETVLPGNEPAKDKKDN